MVSDGTSMLARGEMVKKRPVFNNDAFKNSIEKMNKEKMENLGNILSDDEGDYTDDFTLEGQSKNPAFD